MPALAQSGTAAGVAPVTLRQLLDTVRSGHPLLAAARARVRAARGVRTTAGTFGNPILAFQMENAPRPGRAAPPMDREAMTTATIPLEPLYQRSSRVRRAAAEVRAAQAEAAATGQQVAIDAARAFYRAALAQVGTDAAREVAAWLDTVVAYNRARVTEGVSAEADLIRSELERDRAAADATMREADQARARAELTAFLGRPDGAVDGPVVAVESTPLRMPRGGLAVEPPEAPTTDTSARGVGGALALAAASRPQVVAARERLAAAGAAVTTERAMIVREVGAMVGTKQSVGSTSLVAGVSLPLPIVDRNRGEVARATAQREAAAYELAAAERSARAEVSGAYAAAHLLTNRVTTLAAPGPDGAPLFLARADESRRIALGAYREGAVPLFTVLDAVRAWGEARVAYYEVLFAQHESVLALLAAQGADLTTALPGHAPGAPR